MAASSCIKRSLLILLALLVTAPGCARVPYTERKQLILVSQAEEMELGAAMFRQVKQKEPVSKDPAQNAMVGRVGWRIAGAVNRSDYKWEFVVIQDKDANAFALPGGKVAVYTGILPICKDDAGLAVVMGHEIAHVLARHGAERLSQQEVLSIGQTALMIALTGQNPAVQQAVGQAYGVGAQVGVLLPYSRSQESEADKIGLILMARAGYDPRAAVEFWKRMMQSSGGNHPPALLATHPSDEKRIKDIEAFLPEAMEYYNASQQKR